MTKSLIPSYGRVYLHIVLDCGSEKLVGWNLKTTSKTDNCIAALHHGLNQQYSEGVREAVKQLMLVTDNGCQPTSKAFEKHCKLLNLQHIFTSYANP